MVTLVKHEWHSVDSQFEVELDEALLAEIFPDYDEEQIASLMFEIETGEVSVEDIINEAYEQEVDIEWDRVYDDWYTDRKGGYDVTYEVKE